MAKNWKSRMEEEISSVYPGVKFRWNGDDPTLEIPTDLVDRSKEITEYITSVWRSWGGEVRLDL